VTKINGRGRQNFIDSALTNYFMMRPSARSTRPVLSPARHPFGSVLLLARPVFARNKSGNYSEQLARAVNIDACR